jgi:ribonuclease HI
MMQSTLKKIIIYTDGACSGNPGPGGYGVILKYGKYRKEISKGFRRTTNNRMELMAAIAGLEALKDRCLVLLHTDSKYLVDSITKGWVTTWRERGWIRGKREKVLNPDLWIKLLKLCEYHQVEINWVKGHAGDIENERADQLATTALRQQKLEKDENYENLSEYFPT